MRQPLSYRVLARVGFRPFLWVGDFCYWSAGSMSFPGGSPGVPNQGILHPLPKESSKTHLSCNTRPSKVWQSRSSGGARTLLNR